jgi:hypothetical protein
MKQYLLLVVLIASIGCSTTSYKPVTHPDQRIQLEGFSFLPPKGQNWEVIGNPVGRAGSFEDWGGVTVKVKAFKKSFVGPNQTPDEAEQWKALVNKYEFENHKFDNDGDLMELAQSGDKVLAKKGMTVPESSYSYENFKGMKCVRMIRNIRAGRRLSGSKVATILVYSQGYLCVHPKYPGQLIKLTAEQAVLKGQTPAEFKSEVGPFFNSLEVDG